MVGMFAHWSCPCSGGKEAMMHKRGALPPCTSTFQQYLVYPPLPAGVHDAQAGVRRVGRAQGGDPQPLEVPLRLVLQVQDAAGALASQSWDSWDSWDSWGVFSVLSTPCMVEQAFCFPVPLQAQGAAAALATGSFAGGLSATKGVSRKALPPSLHLVIQPAKVKTRKGVHTCWLC